MRSHNKGFSTIELIISLIVVGVLSVVVYPAYQSYAAGGPFSSLDRSQYPDKYYVFCKDSGGELHQAKGIRIVVSDNSVVVYKQDGTDQIFANMDCWTEDASTKAPEVTHGRE